MHYRSIADLNHTIYRNLGRLPRDVDLVIGIPRSGLLAANVMSLALNLPLADLEGFIEGRLLSAGKTRRRDLFGQPAAAFKRIVVLDDSIFYGHAMREARAKLAALGSLERFTFCAVYGPGDTHPEADLVLEPVPVPRVFQWNLMHHQIVEESCVDIDGVLCCDPTHAQNDDGANYVEFLNGARPLLIPSRRIAHLVTSRLERYRPNTEAWLAAQGVQYGKLWMLDLPSAVERRRLGVHGAFKAEVYKQVDATLFIESEELQAIAIARLSGKPVLSIESQTLIHPAMAADMLERARTNAWHVERRRAIEGRSLSAARLKTRIGRRLGDAGLGHLVAKARALARRLTNPRPQT